MANEFGGDLYDFDTMSDDEIRDLVSQRLREYPNLDADWIEVSVRDGVVTLSGRVGTDGEVQVAQEVLDDVLGIDVYSNELVVDETHRYTAPEAADEALAEEQETDSQMGDPDPNQSDSAEHLVEDLESETFGTHDVGEAVQDGIPYTPPDRPVGGGYGSREDH